MKQRRGGNLFVCRCDRTVFMRSQGRTWSAQSPKIAFLWVAFKAQSTENVIQQLEHLNIILDPLALTANTRPQRKWAEREL